MNDIYQYLGQALNWSREKNAGLILRAGDNQTPLAQITTKGAYASIAEGNCGGESWEFNRSGFLKNNVSVKGDSGKSIAAFKKKGLGGTLEFENGRKFEVSRNGLMTQYSLSLDKRLLVRNEIKGNHMQVSLQPGSEDVPELPLLMIFLGYLPIMQRIDANFSMPF